MVECNEQGPAAASLGCLIHGLIFTGFHAFVAAEWPKLVDELWSDDAPRRLATAAYDDEEFESLVTRAVGHTGVDRDELLRRFGVFTAMSTFRLLYPGYYESHRDTISFLADIEEQIHEVVRRTVEAATPPRLDVIRLSDGGVSITYTSPRMLCQLLEGLVVGVARHYGDSVTVEQPLCMHRGDDAGCTFFVSKA